MKILVGLGNPSAKHAGNRHNIGWMAVDAIASAHGFSSWRSKFQAQVCDGRLGTEKVLVLKPETWMNLSGQAVAEALRFHKVAIDDIIVFHDELDLPPGRFRLKVGGGHAGHNGLRSLHKHLGPDFVRVRLGIGHPGDKSRVSGYVLSDFTAEERKWLAPLLQGVVEGAPRLAVGDLAGFSEVVAMRTLPAQEEAPPPAPPPPESPPEEPAEAEAHSALGRLMARFSKR